jgi:hypothetical protein
MKDEGDIAISFEPGAPDYAELSKSAGRITGLLKLSKIRSRQDAVGALDCFVGAIYGMILAKKGNFKDRLDCSIDINAVVRRAEDAAAGAIRTNGAWMAGFHFNDALFRTAAVYHRVLQVVVNCKNGRIEDLRPKACELYRRWTSDDWLSDNLETVRKQVNKLKHQPEGLFRGRQAQFTHVVSAIGELLVLLEAWAKTL